MTNRSVGFSEIKEEPAVMKSNSSCQLDCVCPFIKMHIHQSLLHCDFCISQLPLSTLQKGFSR